MPLDVTAAGRGSIQPAAQLRRARYAVFAVFFASGALISSWVPRIPAIQGDLNLSEGQLGLALLGVAAGSLIAMPFSGWAASRFGSRPVTLVTLIAMGLALPLPALAGDLVTLGLALAGVGAAFGSLDVAMNVHGVAVERGFGRPILVGFHAAYSVGGLAGAVAGGLFALAGLRPLPHFVIASLAGLAIAAAVAPRLLSPAAESRIAPRVVARDDECRHGQRRSRRLPRRLVLLGVVAFCCMLGEGSMADWSAVYLDDRLGTGPGMAAAGFAAFSLAMAVGRIFGDRITAARGPVSVVRAGALLVAATLGPALLLDHPAAAVVGFAGVGAGLSCIVPVVFSAAGSTPGVAAGAALAVTSTVGYFGLLVGPPLIGFVAEATNLTVGLGVVVVMALLIAGLAGAAAPAASPVANPAPAAPAG